MRMHIRQSDHWKESAMRMIINPMVHLCKTLTALFLIILWPALVNGATIFSDNFDSCTSNCTLTTAGPPSEGGWNAWVTWELTATVGGVTHNSAEITSPGRGGTGKSLKMWKAAGVFGDYAGLNMMTFPGGGTYDHIFMRYYIKIPAALSSSQDYKLWRLMTNSGTAGYNEIYLNYYGGTWSIYDGNAWQNVLTSAQYNSIRDGNWHCIEFEIGISSHTLRLYVDGVVKYEDKNRTWHLTGNLSGMQHFFIGNTYDHTGKWQSGWQAMEADDFVLSTTYVGPVSGGASTPPLPIPKQPNPPVIIQLQ